MGVPGLLRTPRPRHALGELGGLARTGGASTLLRHRQPVPRPGLVVGIDQFRGTYLAAGFIPLIAGPALDRGLTSLEEGRVAIGRWALGLGLVSTVWPSPPTRRHSWRVRFPSGRVGLQAHASVAPLAALPAGTMLAPIQMGPAILLYTPHTIVAAPYHRAIPGLIAAIEGFGGSEADLRRNTTRRA